MPSQIPNFFEPHQMPNPVLTELERPSRENLLSGLQIGHEQNVLENVKSRPRFIELLGVRPRGEVPFRLTNGGEESYRPTGSTHGGEESFRPFIFPETPEEEETVCFGRGGFRLVAPVAASEKPGPNLLSSVRQGRPLAEVLGRALQI